MMLEPPDPQYHRQRPHRQLPDRSDETDEAPTQRIPRVRTQKLPTPVVVDTAERDETDEVPTQRIPRVRVPTPQLSPAAAVDAGRAHTAVIDAREAETTDAARVEADSADAGRVEADSADAQTAAALTTDVDTAADSENADTLPMPRLELPAHQVSLEQTSSRHIVAPISIEKPAKAKRFGFLGLAITTLGALFIGALLGSVRDEGALTAQPTATVTATATATATVSKPTGKPSDASLASGGYDELDVLKFGKYHSYADGIEVSVTSARRSVIPPFVAGSTPGDPMVIVTVKIKNRRKKSSFNTDIVSVNLAYGSSGKPGKNVLVPDVDGFDGTIAKGRSTPAQYAFAVPKKSVKNIVVVINRGLKYPPAIFAGKVS